MAKLRDQPFQIQDTTTQGAGEAYHIGRQRFGFHLIQPWLELLVELKSSKINMSTAIGQGLYH